MQIGTVRSREKPSMRGSTSRASTATAQVALRQHRICRLSYPCATASGGPCRDGTASHEPRLSGWRYAGLSIAAWRRSSGSRRLFGIERYPFKNLVRLFLDIKLRSVVTREGDF